MAETGFQVVFDGQLVDGADQGQAKAGLARLFKTDVARIEPLFAGRPTVVKQGLDAATAEKYRLAFERAGAVATVVGPDGAALATTPPPPSSPASDDAGGVRPGSDSTVSGDGAPSRLEIAEASRAPPPLVARGAVTEPTDLSMAEPGAMLVDDTGPVAAPDIDISHMSLAEPGVDLTEHKEVAAPEYDLAAYELAPPGETLPDT